MVQQSDQMSHRDARASPGDRTTAQKHQLEGEKYCTASCVPSAVYCCCRRLEKCKDSDDSFIKSQSWLVLKDFEKHWGKKDSPYWKVEEGEMWPS